MKIYQKSSSLNSTLALLHRYCGSVVWALLGCSWGVGQGWSGAGLGKECWQARSGGRQNSFPRCSRTGGLASLWCWTEAVSATRCHPQFLAFWASHTVSSKPARGPDSRANLSTSPGVLCDMMYPGGLSLTPG